MTLRLKRGGSLAVATHNQGKLREFRDLLDPYGIKVLSSGELGVPEPVETGETFEENAQLKAVITAFASGMPALADNSGLAHRGFGRRARHPLREVGGRAARFSPRDGQGRGRTASQGRCLA